MYEKLSTMPVEKAENAILITLKNKALQRAIKIFISDPAVRAAPLKKVYSSYAVHLFF